MGKFKKGPQRKAPPKPPIQKTRKELRKEQRKEKKLRRTMRNQRKQPEPEPEKTNSTKDIKNNRKGPQHAKQSQPKLNKLGNDEKSRQKKIESQMGANRKKQLLAANEDEDRHIRHLEKLLKINQRRRGKAKPNGIPKSFKEDGLGYLLEVCDPETLKDSARVDQVLQDSGSEFEEDFAIVKGKEKEKAPKGKSKDRKPQSSAIVSDEDDSGSDFGLGVDDGSDDGASEDENMSENGDILDDMSGDDMSDAADMSDDGDMLDDGSESDASEIAPTSKAAKQSKAASQSKKKSVSWSEDVQQNPESSKKGKDSNSSIANKKKREDSYENKEDEEEEDWDGDDGGGDGGEDNEDFDSDESMCEDDDDQDDVKRNKSESRKNPDGTWEDIYGRTRDKGGNVIDATPGKYIPPALRAKMQGNEDEKRKEILSRLRRQMKGLLNRLAENNMTSICNQMDELYMKNSRNDMNETLLTLYMEALVSTVLTPERLVMEHMLLIAVLHANVGSEVGAHFLQSLMNKFDEMLGISSEVENKELDNVILILSHLYNFKIFSASLMYEVMDRIAEVLDEKRIELLLVVLRSVGFSLRKDDPLALKNLILKVQEKASSSSAASSASSRVRFMLDILMAIKNNNVSKIPSYSPEHIEHLKKLMRTLIRRGNYVAELKITLEDLLKADERGRWWIVGSAWTGHLPGENPESNQNSLSEDTTKSVKSSDKYSAQLLELVRKQRMNTGVRKDIFCILMSAEDYLDAFEKLLHLNLKNQQRQEIVAVLFDCCLQEKSFNPYYAHLSQKFCEFDRQYQMKFQYCLWDKLKELDKFQKSQMINLAKLLAHLFLEKGLPISALKVMSFAEMDKACIRLVRQILLTILLSEDVPKCEEVFRRVAPSAQLHLFREGLRLFINHFVVRKGSKSLPEQEFQILQERAKVAEKLLSSTSSKVAF
ncbi:nucleolar MIF4G domain-containing protein 1 homolog [Thrips palmi]|uniref:Nucleolar MIF4G domain-containing protein 1 homolog n=1 Tax=Thrips palmi TaxID=161013 RepID=A0A6P8Z9J8_THRPL|nr:nucleolar MIF4G domain-containing protein 1 homolog [Thrips palmi]